MPKISLPDNSVLEFDHPISVKEVAEKIGSGLAKAALAGKVDDKLVDLDYVIEKDSDVAIITEKDKEALDIIRHSTAHLLAQAVLALYPDVQITIGPAIENGFYYDFSYEKPFTPEDLEKIQAKMEELAKEDFPMTHRKISRNDAIKFFKELGQNYKAELIEAIPEDQVITLYQQGDFIDLCRGPHVPSTGKLKAFNLMKLAGAYWRGDSNNEMLQRIYGTAWLNKKDLEVYLTRLEEAEKRDHRKLGKAMDLFHLQEEAPGMVFWHHNGFIIYKSVIEYMRSELRKRDYQEIYAPLMLDRSLWEKSGHWDKFADLMFTTESENRQYAIKPMNCPGHIQIYNHGLKSYRDLPLRMAEFGLCHRNEHSGTLHGLMRIREFTQDDAHVFCTEDQLQDEVAKLIEFVYDVYHHFGFDNLAIRLATRPEKRIGEDEVWNRAEEALENSLHLKKLPFEFAPGEGAFYGPKLEFHLKDSIGRSWQCGTIQIDFSMPVRLGAEYVAEDGTRKTPIMIHRAILGSIERFIAVLLEHYAGLLPLWLAPQQVYVMNITDRQAEYAKNLVKTLTKHGFRAKSDLRNEKIGYKIREHTLERVPYLVVLGDRELESGAVAVRTQAGKDLGSMPIEKFITLLEDEIAQSN